MVKRTPSFNIFENEDDFKIQLSSPGMNKRDFVIDVNKNLLTISADQKSDDKEETRRYSIQEFNYNFFKRVFDLPKNTNKDKVSAKYVDRTFEIYIPKLAEEKATKNELLFSK